MSKKCTWRRREDSIAGKIRKTLEAGSLNHAQILERLPQYKARQITNSLNVMVSKGNGIVRVDVEGELPQYALASAMPKPVEEKPKLRRYVPAFVPLRRDPFEHRALCELARR